MAADLVSGLLATTTATLLRGGETDALGDAVAVDTPVSGAVGVPCSIIERTRSVFDPASSAWRLVTYSVARFVPGTFAALEGDRVRDESTSRVYVVRRVKATARTLAGLGAFSLELVDVGGFEVAP